MHATDSKILLCFTRGFMSGQWSALYKRGRCMPSYRRERPHRGVSWWWRLTGWLSPPWDRRHCQPFGWGRAEAWSSRVLGPFQDAER